MTIEALWSAQFGSDQQLYGAGVMVLETNRVLGGDGQYFYVGEYMVSGGQIHTTIHVTHYAGMAESIFGLRDQFNVRLTGKVSDQSLSLNGELVEDPDIKMRAILTRRAELP